MMMRPMMLLALLFATAALYAQEVGDLRFELEDFELSEEEWDDTYPDMNLRAVGSGGGDDWVRFAVRFTLTDRDANRRNDYTWIDQLTCNWNIVLASGERGLNNPRPEHSVRFKRSIQYVHVKTSGRGTEYWALIFMPPEVMERYGDKGNLLPDEYIMGRLDIKRGHRHVGTVWFRGDEATEGERAPSRVVDSFVNSEDPAIIPNTLFHRLETPWSYAGSDAEKMMRLHPGATSE